MSELLRKAAEKARILISKPHLRPPASTGVNVVGQHRTRQALRRYLREANPEQADRWPELPDIEDNGQFKLLTYGRLGMIHEFKSYNKTGQEERNDFLKAGIIGTGLAAAGGLAGLGLYKAGVSGAAKRAESFLRDNDRLKNALRGIRDWKLNKVAAGKQAQAASMAAAKKSTASNMASGIDAQKFRVERLKAAGKKPAAPSSPVVAAPVAVAPAPVAPVASKAAKAARVEKAGKDVANLPVPAPVSKAQGKKLVDQGVITKSEADADALEIASSKPESSSDALRAWARKQNALRNAKKSGASKPVGPATASVAKGQASEFWENGGMKVPLNGSPEHNAALRKKLDELHGSGGFKGQVAGDVIDSARGSVTKSLSPKKSSAKKAKDEVWEDPDALPDEAEWEAAYNAGKGAAPASRAVKTKAVAAKPEKSPEAKVSASQYETPPLSPMQIRKLQAERRAKKANRIAKAEAAAAAAKVAKKGKGKKKNLSALLRRVRFFDQFQTDEAGIPLTGRVARDRFVKKLRDEDLDRRDANILRAGGAGALAGLMARGRIGASKRALIGAGAGGLGVIGIRALTNNDRDIYGERDRGSKRAELLPAVGGLGAAAWFAGKRLKAFAKKFNGRVKEFGSMGLGRLYRKKVALLKKGLFVEHRNPAYPGLPPGLAVETAASSVAGGVNPKTGRLVTTQMFPLKSDQGKYAGVFDRISHKNKPRTISGGEWDGIEVIDTAPPGEWPGGGRQARIHADALQRHRNKMRGLSARLRGMKNFDDYRLYYFKGRNTGIAARSAEEARKKKKRGGDELVAVRTPSDSEKSQMARGVWVRTRRDGKSPGQSRYGKGRGQGPARKSLSARFDHRGHREISGKLREFAEKRERGMNPYVGAGLSGFGSGAALGSLALLRRGATFRGAAKMAGKLGLASAGIVGGGALLGSKIVGDPRKEESAPFMKRAAIGGTLVGAGAGLGGALLLRKTKGGERALVAASKKSEPFSRPAMWLRKAPLAGAAGIGVVGGALYGGGMGADEGQQVDSIRNLRKDMKKFSTKIKLREFSAMADTAKRAAKAVGGWTKRNATAIGLTGAGVGASVAASRHYGPQHQGWKKLNEQKEFSAKLRLLGRWDQPRHKDTKAYAGPIQGWVTGEELVNSDGTPWQASSPQLVNAMMREAARQRTNVQRGGRLTRDVSAVIQGKDRERDASGRIKKREWEKSWFKNKATEVGLGLSGLGVAALARYGHMNPNTRIGRAYYNGLKSYGKTKEDLSKVAGGVMGAVNNATGPRKGFSAKFKKLRELDALAEYAGWDIRDPRGKSARVFAPGSRKRERRQKEWHEKTENERKLWKAGIAAGVLGGAGAALLGQRVVSGKSLVPSLFMPKKVTPPAASVFVDATKVFKAA